jgi:hypothetical protein
MYTVDKKLINKLGLNGKTLKPGMMISKMNQMKRDEEEGVETKAKKKATKTLKKIKILKK